MDFNRFTEKMQEAVRTAQSLATVHGNQQVDVEHLLLALLEQEGGLAPSILNKADIQVDALRTRVQQEIDRLPKVSGPSGHFGQSVDFLLHTRPQSIYLYVGFVENGRGQPAFLLQQS